jgi:hypothetical protein
LEAKDSAKDWYVVDAWATGLIGVFSILDEGNLVLFAAYLRNWEPERNRIVGALDGMNRVEIVKGRH